MSQTLKELESIRRIVIGDDDGVLQKDQVAVLTSLIDQAREKLAIQSKKDELQRASWRQRFSNWNRQIERLGETKGILLFFHIVVVLWCLVGFPVSFASGDSLTKAPFETRMGMLWSVLPLVLVYDLPCIWLAFNLRRVANAILWLALAGSVLFTSICTVWALNLTESPFELYRENLLMQFSILILLALMNAGQAIWVWFAINARSELDSASSELN